VTREEILSVYEQGPDAVVCLVEGLLAVIRDHEERLKCLEDQLSKDSRNSSKPPSTDAYSKPKPKSQRKSTGRKPGGQQGHQGHFLQPVAHPDHTVSHSVGECEECGRGLTRVKAEGQENRQVFDLPPMQLEVTQHQAEIKRCPCCGHLNRGTFPEEVTHPAQYGCGVRGFAVYLNQYQMIPYERVEECFKDLFGHELSQGSLVNINDQCYRRLELIETALKEQLVNSEVVHLDETGFRFSGKCHWLHVASTENLTYFFPHPKRGKKATEDINILPLFQGTAIHDNWSAYHYYECAHGLCNDHQVRELTFLHEEHGQEWALEMKNLLLDIYRAVQEAKKSRPKLTPKQIREFENQYEQFLQRGFDANPLPSDEGLPKKRGRKKKTKSQDLLERLKDHKQETLAFMYDFNIPFGNNLAERDIRMMEVKQKISGSFRSDRGARVFCRIRGYISTMKKQSINVMDAIRSVFIGKPIAPALGAPE